MNARIQFAPPSDSATQALDGCAAVALFFLETSGKYFDLHVDALKGQVDGFFRSGALRDGKGADQSTAEVSQLFAESARETGRLVRESLSLSVESQRELTDLLSQSSTQVTELVRQQFAAAQSGFNAYLQNPAKFFK